MAKGIYSRKNIIPWNKGKKTGIVPSSAFKKGSVPWNKGIPASEELRKFLASLRLGIPSPNKGKSWKQNLSIAQREALSERMSGRNNPNWIEDRNSVKKTDREHNDPVYKQWKKEVHTRDEGKCKINNEDCSGRLEAHHILTWSKYPELRYKTDNGISLCHYHHPRKREEELTLAPLFQEMVLNLK